MSQSHGIIDKWCNNVLYRDGLNKQPIVICTDLVPTNILVCGLIFFSSIVLFLTDVKLFQSNDHCLVSGMIDWITGRSALITACKWLGTEPVGLDRMGQYVKSAHMS